VPNRLRFAFVVPTNSQQVRILIDQYSVTLRQPLAFMPVFYARGFGQTKGQSFRRPKGTQLESCVFDSIR
jgi:hypothetical protein